MGTHFLTFSHHFIEMHFLEATDIGHLMIYYDGKVRKERKQEEKRPDSGRD